MVDVTLSEPQFGEAIGNAPTEVEDDAQAFALDQGRGGGATRAELASSGSEKSET